MYELNFIWVGPANMPSDQLAHLEIVKDLSKDVVVRVWCTTDIYPQLKQRLINKGFILEDINQLLDPEKYPVTAAFVALLRDASLPSGLGDILKFLILTRPVIDHNLDKRFYMEADNDYSLDFARLVDNRPFMFAPGTAVQIKELMARPDAFFIDTAKSINIMQLGYEHVEILLSDPIIKHNLEQIIELNKKQGFTAKPAVFRSFGAFPSTLCKSLLLRDGKWSEELANPRFASHSRRTHQSWANTDVDESIQMEDLSIQFANTIAQRCYEIMVDVSYWQARSVDMQQKASTSRLRPQ